MEAKLKELFGEGMRETGTQASTSWSVTPVLSSSFVEDLNRSPEPQFSDSIERSIVNVLRDSTRSVEMLPLYRHEGRTRTSQYEITYDTLHSGKIAQYITAEIVHIRDIQCFFS